MGCTCAKLGPADTAEAASQGDAAPKHTDVTAAVKHALPTKTAATAALAAAPTAAAAVPELDPAPPSKDGASSAARHAPTDGPAHGVDIPASEPSTKGSLVFTKPPPPVTPITSPSPATGVHVSHVAGCGAESAEESGSAAGGGSASPVTTSTATKHGIHGMEPVHRHVPAEAAAKAAAEDAAKVANADAEDIAKAAAEDIANAAAEDIASAAAEDIAKAAAKDAAKATAEEAAKRAAAGKGKLSLLVG